MTTSQASNQGKLRWGILGAGNIAKAFANGVHHCKSGVLVAVGSRTKEKAKAFGDANNVPAAGQHGSYEALLADPNVDAVYVATPHPMHAQWTILAAEAGKHVLCEKPIGINHAQAMAMFEAAKRSGVFLMEAFMYRCHPQTAKLVELLHDKAIGDVKLIEASFGFRAGFNEASRLFNNDLAGGGILDVGCYPMSLSRLVAGVAMGKDYADPISVTGCGKLSSTGVDEYAIGTLRFAGDIVAQISTAVTIQLENVVRVHGSLGKITIPWPWIPAREGGSVKLQLHIHGKDPQEIDITTTDWLYGLEADAFAQGVRTGKAPHPAMSEGDTMGNIRALDQWRAAIGLIYNSEKPDVFVPTITNRPLKVAAKNHMIYGKVAGLEKPVSRLIMGCDNQQTLQQASVMWDDFFEKGGNTYDTAWIYGGGLQERLLGQWVRNRNIRDQVVIISKGAHTPWCNPNTMREHMKTCLDRLKMDYVDLYIMHRDNLDIPVSEFIDLLNEWKKAGLVRAFGGSNWSLPRIEEANAYAAKKGVQGFSLVNNNFSLAEMVNPIWAGCIHCSDEASIAWLTKNQLPQFSWSSQARGFFTDRAGPDKLGDRELAHTWYSAENFKRRDRVYEMAKKKNVLPINIALAYVLCQPFPSFALIGPRSLEETRTSMPGLDVKLTEAEVKWLRTGV